MSGKGDHESPSTSNAREAPQNFPLVMFYIDVGVGVGTGIGVGIGIDASSSGFL